MVHGSILGMKNVSLQLLSLTKPPRVLESKRNDSVNIRECYEYDLEVFSPEKGWTADFDLSMPRIFCLLCISLSSRHL